MHWLESLRQAIGRHPIAVKMSYPERMEAKLQILLAAFPQPSRRLAPFFQACLGNASLKTTQLETLLRFYLALPEAERPAVQELFGFLWPQADPALLEQGLSEDKQARVRLTEDLLARGDALRRFVKSTPACARRVRTLAAVAFLLRCSRLRVLELVALRPRLLRGLVKPPRPLYAGLMATLTSWPMLTLSNNPSIPGLTLSFAVWIAALTWVLSTRCLLAPGVLTFAKTRRRLQEAMAGAWRPSPVVERMRALGVNVEEYQRARRYDCADQRAGAGASRPVPQRGEDPPHAPPSNRGPVQVRIEVRDKRTLEGAAQFLTSSEEIGNCIALRNFVSWCLPSLLDDETVQLADVSLRGSQRAQIWMVAGERDGQAVLTVNSLEFNNEGAKYVEELMPCILETLRDVAQRAGFRAVYLGISDFGRDWLDRHLPQGEHGEVRKVHCPELGHRYAFDAYRRSGSHWVFSQTRSPAARLYALSFGLLEQLRGNHAKAAAFFDSARNRNNFWQLPLEGR